MIGGMALYAAPYWRYQAISPVQVEIWGSLEGREGCRGEGYVAWALRMWASSGLFYERREDIYCVFTEIYRRERLVLGI